MNTLLFSLDLKPIEINNNNSNNTNNSNNSNNSNDNNNEDDDNYAEKCRKYALDYYYRNREQIAEQRKLKYEQNKEAILEKKRERYRKSKEAIKRKLAQQQQQYNSINQTYLTHITSN